MLKPLCDTYLVLTTELHGTNLSIIKLTITLLIANVIQSRSFSKLTSVLREEIEREKNLAYYDIFDETNIENT